uniref:Uncharacterized protein n=1 Tax=Clytia hemisphaerica TaxID=252671 RepID=A0A7M5X7K3_9CNID
MVEEKTEISDNKINPTKIDVKDDSVDVNELKQRLKRKSDIGIGNEIKKPKVDNGEQPVLSEEIFEWPLYLASTGSAGVKKELFQHIVPECMCGFESGMKLEVPNKDYKNTYWLATIIAKATPLILVRYEGFKESNNADFWCNTLTDDIHPVGWCARTKHALKPPKAIQDQETNWYAYLIKNLTGTRKASESLFLKKSHPVHYLRAGHYVEVIDLYNPTCYWLARIVEIFAGRLSLQYEGYEDKQAEFWCYYLDERLRPVGHGLKNALTLYPPKVTPTISHGQFKRITEKLITLSRRSDNAVFKSLFQGWKQKEEHNLRLGMKLEAINPQNPSEICVATVTRIFDPFYFLVKIDNLISVQEDVTTDSFVARKGQAGIFPVGYCFKNGVHLQQPKGFNGKFTWDGYLKYTKTEAVSDSFFPELKAPEDFMEGMKLEAVDPDHNSNICVATIRRVVGGHLWLHIDGDTRGEMIYAYNSFNIFPVGWCEETGHELQWPRPETLEQKNRISSLRHTATRRNRLEDLRKGKVTTVETRDPKKDVAPNQKVKANKNVYRKGRRGVSRKQGTYNEESSEGTVDTSIAFVCINRLAEEFNTEKSIKEFYNLDAQNRLPAQIVTIDDDDDNDDGSPKKNDATTTYSEQDLNYLSLVRVKPNKLSKTESEMFDKNLNEHSAEDVEDDLTSQGRGKGRSLNSVISMLTATRNQPRPSHLLEQYKQSKNKNKQTTQSKENINVIDLSNDDAPSAVKTNIVESAPDGSINIPGKGQYKIMEQIVTKQGDRNKIILRLGKPVKTNQPVVEKRNKSKTTVNSNAVSPSRDITSPRTSVDDMYTLENMVHTHQGLDEMLRNRFKKVHTFCAKLPRNPLMWTRKHVSTFINNANFAKYASNFSEQEIDGHALMLLTVQEIHHMLGVKLGPAMKIHDLIYSLQQLVNEAYLANSIENEKDSLHEISHSDATTTEENESLFESRPSENGNDEVIENVSSIQPNDVEISKKIDEQIEKMEVKSTNSVKDEHENEVEKSPLKQETKISNTDIIDNTPGESKQSNAKVSSWMDQNNDALEKVRMETCGDFEKEYYGLVNQTYGSNTNPYLVRGPPIQTPGHKHPVRFIQIRPLAGSNPNMIYPPMAGAYPRFIQPPPTSAESPQQMPFILKFGSVKDLEGGTHPSATSEKIDTKSKKTKNSKSEDRKGSERRKRKSDVTAAPRSPKHIRPGALAIIPKYPDNSKEIYDKHLGNVEIELINKKLWDDFFNTGTEMILTRNGRRMFPALGVKFTGMLTSSKYVILLDFIPADQFRYKFEYKPNAPKWMVACEEGTPKPTQVYIHPFSPQFGFEWCRTDVSFIKCKLTNNYRENCGHILMQSMHKYQPRINVLYWDGTLPFQITPHEMMRLCVKKSFMFEQTQFIAVTAYQNNEVTNLKIQSNPFARGFRGDWRKTKAKRTNQKKDTSTGFSYEDENEEEDYGGSDDEQSQSMVGEQSQSMTNSMSFDDKENDNDDAMHFNDTTIVKVEPEY